jgi:MYXO-CTERM domain-containing protein
VEATSSEGAIVPFAVMTTSATSTTYSKDPGSVFPLGRTLVTAAATDSQGTEESCTFEVNVVDTTPPVIAPPQDITVESPTPDGVSVEFPEAVVTEAVALASVVATPASGSVFPIGVTPVTVVATDAAGNHSEATFTVTVVLALHKVSAGCGCSSGETWSGAVLLLGLVIRLRRRAPNSSPAGWSSYTR